ncbi:MAG: hypothetical protein MJ137_07070 [Clostridia bacterium]|nr:hypothetical protein [Clostridia bacterium]
MPNDNKKKSLQRQITAERLNEMLREIEIDAAGSVKEGEYSARARITALFDRGSFSETDRFIARSSEPDEASGVITGYGSVGGRLVFAFAEDRSRMKGAFDSVSGKKITDLFAAAIRNRAPIVGIFDSDGMCIGEGVAAMSALGAVAAASASADGIIPRIALVPGVLGGTEAAIAGGFDFIVSLKKSDGTGSDIFGIPPFLTGVRNTPADCGFSCCEAESEAELADIAKRIISVIPSHRGEGASIADHDPAEENRSPDVSCLTGGELCEAFADTDSCIRLYEKYTEGLALAIAPVGGVGCFIAAGNRLESDGCLTEADADALERCVSFADRFGMPLIFLTDCPGLASDNGSASYLKTVSRLQSTIARASNPRVAAFMGRAYGAGFMLLGSKSSGTDIVYATPDACISALSPEASVAFVWNDRVKAGDLSSSREMLEREWKERLSSPAEAALLGEVDDIVPAAELRPRVLSAIYMLLGKMRRDVGRRWHK